jgi:hypothetical protein
VALQNRVTPFGEIIAAPERGTLMGNRGGCFHDAARRLAIRRWVSERWIACRLEFRGWHRDVMTPGRYTELFFLDEATALAAGHRPCSLCRREDFLRFRAAWLDGNPAAGLAPGCSISAIDRVLHAERLRVQAGDRPRRSVGLLPDGVFVEFEDRPGTAFLLFEGRAREWSPGGYGGGIEVDPAEEAAILTPLSVVRATGAGYVPALHPGVARGAAAMRQKLTS